MAKVTLKNLKDLEKYINSVIQQSLKEDVAPVVVETMQRHIQEDVYNVYTPQVYERQEYNGGLIDEENIRVKQIKNGIEVQNMRVDEDTGKYIAYTVETGQGYDYLFPYANRPRPFTENTRKELIQTGEHIEVLKHGLKKKGIQVK